MVGFNAVLTSEHFASFLVFGILHAALAIIYIKVQPLSPAAPQRVLGSRQPCYHVLSTLPCN